MDILSTVSLVVGSIAALLAIVTATQQISRSWGLWRRKQKQQKKTSSRKRSLADELSSREEHQPSPTWTEHEPSSRAPLDNPAAQMLLLQSSRAKEQSGETQLAHDGTQEQ